MEISNLIKKKASLSLELILSITLLGIVFVSITGGLFYSTQSTSDSSFQTKASILSEEGLEAVKSIKNKNFSALTNGTFGLSKNNNRWEFSGSSQVIDNYTREIIVSSVDAGTKKVVSKVSWSQYGSPKSVETTRTFSNWNTITVANRSWANPIQTFNVNLPNGNTPVDFVIENNIAYIIKSNGNPNLQIYDVSNKANIAFLGGANLSSNLTSIEKKDNYVYITSEDNNAEVIVVNVSNPSNPSQVSTYNAIGNVDAISGTIWGNYYIFGRKTSSYDEIYFLDISNPNSPYLVNSLGYSGNVNSLLTIGNSLFVGSSSDSEEVSMYVLFSAYFAIKWSTKDLSGGNDVVHLNAYNNDLIVGRTNGDLYILNPGFFLNELAYIKLYGTINSTSVDPGNNYIFVNATSSAHKFVVLEYTSQLGILSNISLDGIGMGVIYDPTKDVCFVITSDSNKDLVVIEPN